MASLRLYLFGPPRLEEDGEPVLLERRKVLALFAYLTISDQHHHSRDTLATLLWHDSSQRNARANLRRCLYRLNQHLPDQTLTVTRETVEVNPEADLWVDVLAFQEYAGKCTAADRSLQDLSPACVTALEAAADLYNDAFMTGFSLFDSVSFDDWQSFQREHFQQLMARVLARLTGFYRRKGHFEKAIDYARRWLSLDTLREEVHRALMELYALSGQRLAALRHYEECERILREELGVEPEAETVQLFDAIKAGSFPPAALQKRLVSAARPPARFSVPNPLTPFVGRERELSEIGQLLQDPACRLLTLVGPGGIGKTRTALEAARAHQENFAHGALYVSLASAPAASYLIPSIGDALDFTFAPQADKETQLARHLAERELLLVLDNFEHLLAGGPVLTEILSRAPRLKIFVTARERLNLQGEWVYTLGGLLLPDASSSEKENSALALFAQAARRARNDFALTEVNSADVATICRLVGGLPLAIELAASWVRLMPCYAIAGEIADSLDLLQDEARDRPERHRNIRLMLAHSWALLPTVEQETLAQLALFRGAFTREGAAEVAEASLPLLSSLVDKSLVRREENDRYRLHALLRHYGLEQLEEHPTQLAAARERLALYYAHYLERSLPRLFNEQQRQTLQELVTHIDDLRQVWEELVVRIDGQQMCGIARAVCYLYELRGQFEEGLELFERAAKVLSPGPTRAADAAYAHVLNQQAWFCLRLGRVDDAQAVLRDSRSFLERLKQEAPVAWGDCHLFGSIVVHSKGEIELARAEAERALACFRSVQDEMRLAFCCDRLGRIELSARNHHHAYTHYQAGLALARRLKVPHALASTTASLGVAALETGRFEEAQQLLQESLILGQELQYDSSVGKSLRALGTLALKNGDLAQAIDYFQRSAKVLAESEDRLRHVETLLHLGQALLMDDEPEQAAETLLMARAQAQAAGSQYWVSRIETALAAAPTGARQPKAMQDTIPG